jgi:hypothetical protein
MNELCLGVATAPASPGSASGAGLTVDSMKSYAGRKFHDQIEKRGCSFLQ